MCEAQKRKSPLSRTTFDRRGDILRVFMMFLDRTARTLTCLLLIVMAGAEVQETLSPDCKQFLYMGTLPRGLEEKPFKKICQFYMGSPRFVTLYDTFNHIPVYSAYTFKRSDGSKKVDVPWMYEPQVGSKYWVHCLFLSGVKQAWVPELGEGILEILICLNLFHWWNFHKYYT